MRWFIFFTVQVSGLAASASALTYGPSPWTAIPAGSMLWLIRLLFVYNPQDPSPSQCPLVISESAGDPAKASQETTAAC